MKLLFWNVNRLSAGDKAARARFDRVMGVVAGEGADVVGLTEVSRTGLTRLEVFAQDHGYTALRRPADGHRTHAALLVSSDMGVLRSETALALDNRDGTLGSEAIMATVNRQAGATVSVAVVYNYSPWPAVVDAVQQFADTHSAGKVVVGGDFNMARSLDTNPGLRHLGSSAFERLRSSLGWANVLPGPDGSEVTTWPINGSGGSPRQLDHFFTRLPADATASCSVVVPSDPVSDGTAGFSDHALLSAVVLG